MTGPIKRTTLDLYVDGIGWVTCRLRLDAVRRGYVCRMPDGTIKQYIGPNDDGADRWLVLVNEVGETTCNAFVCASCGDVESQGVEVTPEDAERAVCPLCGERGLGLAIVSPVCMAPVPHGDPRLTGGAIGAFVAERGRYEWTIDELASRGLGMI